MKFYSCVFVFIFSLIQALGVVAELTSSQSPDAAQMLVSHLIQMNALKASFRQRVWDEKGHLQQQVEGNMALQRPLQFYWEITSTGAQKIIADGKQLWIYDIELEQATVQKIDAAAYQTPLVLLSGEPERLRSVFEVYFVPGIHKKERFILRPRSVEQEHMFQQLILEFMPSEQVVEQQSSVKSKQPLPRMIVVTMELLDHLGQKAVLDFSQITINGKIPQHLFQWQAPADVDVIDQF